ncbi:hypothetical protein JW898_03065 [Candidatus Woesearchaeota archaeon]|nr:hypothetical protein [Candidatus Woesearchaeota archaeon]
MPKRKTLEDEVRETAYHALKDNSFMGKLEPNHLWEDPSVSGVVASEEWRRGVIDLFTRDIPTGRNKVKPTGWEDIPREFWPVDAGISSYGHDGRAPSYYKHAHKGPVTFIDVFQERYDQMTVGERRKFIRKFADKNRPMNLLEGQPVTDVEPHVLEFIREELISINPKATPYRRSHRNKIEFAGLCLVTALTLGVIYWGMTSESTHRRPRAASAAVIPLTAPEPLHVTPPAEAKPPAPLTPTEIALAEIPADILQTNPALIECQGETYQDISRRFSGSARYAKIIKEYNKAHIPSFNYHSNRCEKGKLLLFPPRMLDELTREPIKDYRRHGKRG